MKKTHLFRAGSIAVLMLSLIFLQSCKSDKSKMVAQKWGIEDVTYEGNFNEQEKAGMDAAKEMMKSVTYDFHADSTFEIQVMGFNQKGKWWLAEDGAKLVTVSDGGGKREETMSVEVLEENKMTLAIEKDGKKMKLMLSPKKEEAGDKEAKQEGGNETVPGN